MPALGLGTFHLFGDRCKSVVREAIDLGYRHFDTAQTYGNEAEIGDAISESGLDRSEFFVATKLWFWNYRRADAIASAEDSVRKLGGKEGYIDLLLMHWPSPDRAVPLRETLDAMADVQRSGRVRFIGVCNFNSAYLREAVEDCAADLLCNQVEFHPLLRQDALRRQLKKYDMMLTAFSPLADGTLVTHERLISLAERHDKTPSQIVLRWLLSMPAVAAIPKAASSRHLKENISIFDFELSDAECKSIADLARGVRLVNPCYAAPWDRD